VIDHHEMSKRILSELEEAGEENAASLLNTVIEPTGSQIELSSFNDAVSHLEREGLIELEWVDGGENTNSNRTVHLDESSRFVQHLRFNESNGRWSFVDTTRFPSLVATSEGLEMAESLLRERGYQWWRKSNV